MRLYQFSDGTGAWHYRRADYIRINANGDLEGWKKNPIDQDELLWATRQSCWSSVESPEDRTTSTSAN